MLQVELENIILSKRQQAQKDKGLEYTSCEYIRCESREEPMSREKSNGAIEGVIASLSHEIKKGLRGELLGRRGRGGHYRTRIKTKYNDMAVRKWHDVSYLLCMLNGQI